MSKRTYQFQIPLFIVSFLTVLLICEYFFVVPVLSDVKSEITLWGSILGAIAMLYASILLIMSNLRKVVDRKGTSKDIFKSVVFLGTVAMFLLLGLTDTKKLTAGDMFMSVYLPTMGVMGSMVWVNSNTWASWAAIRELSRIRSLEAVVVWVMCILTVVGRTTGLVAAVPVLNEIATWIRMVGDSTARTAAIGAAGIGGIILAIRAIIGKEPGLVEMEV